jgi:hypothetical protein
MVQIASFIIVHLREYINAEYQGFG